jgi:hypothetical protein
MAHVFQQVKNFGCEIMKEHYLAIIKFPMLVSVSLFLIAALYFGMALAVITIWGFRPGAPFSTQ